MTAILHSPIEHVDRRALGALRLVDATSGQTIRRRLEIDAGGLTLRRNRRGLHVIERAPGLEDLTRNFEQQPVPPNPGTVPFDLRVDDPQDRWLPRSWRLQLPRDPAPQNADEADSLFRPQEVTLFPTPSASIAPAWALVRASLRRQGVPLGGALIEVTVPGATPEDEPAVFHGMTDWRGRRNGEGLVAIPGIRFLSPSGDDGNGNGDDQPPVLSRTVPVSIRILFDAAFAPELGQLPDPDRLLEANQLTVTDPIDRELASGRTLVLEQSI